MKPRVRHTRHRRYALHRERTIVLLIILGSVACAVEQMPVGSAPDAASTTSPISTSIHPGQSIAEAVDANPAGTTFLIRAGVHRLQSVEPKSGQSFIGEPGAVLSGARLLTEFTREDGVWVATGQDQEGPVHGECESDFDGVAGYDGCRHPEDLFVDDVPLIQVIAPGQLGPGRWCFDYAGDRVLLHDDPTGHRVEISVTPHAFRSPPGRIADDVTIRGLIIEKYATPAQQGAVQAGLDTPESFTHGWSIEESEIRLNHGAGVRLGHGTRVIGNHIHHNGQIGVLGIGDDVLVDGNEIAHNNTMGFSAGWEAGGTKFVRTRNLIVRDNDVHDNAGPGLWTDIDNIDTLYEGNTVRDNAGSGIFHEISYAAIIRNNTVSGNGFDTPGWLYGAGILIAHSPDVEVHDNTVVDNANGIGGIQQDRGSGRHGPHDLANCWVHHNQITMRVGRTGFARDVGDDGFFTDRNNRFDFNTYHLGPESRYFEFDDRQLDEASWVEYGQDANGTFQR